MLNAELGVPSVSRAVPANQFVPDELTQPGRKQPATRVIFLQAGEYGAPNFLARVFSIRMVRESTAGELSNHGITRRHEPIQSLALASLGNEPASPSADALLRQAHRFGVALAISGRRSARVAGSHGRPSPRRNLESRYDNAKLSSSSRSRTPWAHPTASVEPEARAE